MNTHGKGPVIAVVMACYNAEQTIARAIDSILAQTEPDFDFMIIDDASHDQTVAILHRYQAADSRIRLILNPVNRGLAYCLNQGIKQTNAPFIARMDADDVSLPQRLARQLAYLQRHPETDVLGTGTELVDCAGQWMGTLVLPASHEQIIRQRYLRPLFIHPSVMFRRAFFDRCGYYNEQLRRTEDLDLWLRARNTAAFENLPDILMRYTYKPQSPLDTVRSDLAVRFRHMHASGELGRKGYELVLFFIRYVLLNYTGYVSQSFRVIPTNT